MEAGEAPRPLRRETGLLERTLASAAAAEMLLRGGPTTPSASRSSPPRPSSPSRSPSSGWRPTCARAHPRAGVGRPAAAPAAARRRRPPRAAGRPRAARLPRRPAGLVHAGRQRHRLARDPARLAAPALQRPGPDGAGRHPRRAPRSAPPRRPPPARRPVALPGRGLPRPHRHARLPPLELQRLGRAAAVAGAGRRGARRGARGARRRRPPRPARGPLVPAGGRAASRPAAPAACSRPSPSGSSRRAAPSTSWPTATSSPRRGIGSRRRDARPYTPSSSRSRMPRSGTVTQSGRLLSS